MAYQRFSGNQLARPRWLADFGGDRVMQRFPAKLSKNAFQNFLGIDIQLTAPAAQGATTLNVVAVQLPQPSTVLIIATGQQLIPQGAMIVLDPLLGKMAITKAPVKQGDTTISVQPIPTALTGSEDAKFNQYGHVFVPSGVLLGRVYAAQGPYFAGDPNIHDDLGLLVYDNPDLLQDDDCELFRTNIGLTVKENYLPQFAVYGTDPGIADPIAAPVLSVAGGDGTLPVGPYFVGFSYGNANGETKISPLNTVTVAAGNHITVASPGAFPANATYQKVYVSPAPNDVNVQAQGVLSAAGPYNALTVGTGKSPSANNTSKGGFGRQLDYIRKAYKCIIGKD